MFLVNLILDYITTIIRHLAEKILSLIRACALIIQKFAGNNGSEKITKFFSGIKNYTGKDRNNAWRLDEFSQIFAKYGLGGGGDDGGDDGDKKKDDPFYDKYGASPYPFVSILLNLIRQLLDTFIPMFFEWSDAYLSNVRITALDLAVTGLTPRECLEWFIEGFNTLNIRLLESIIMIGQYIERIRNFIIRYIVSDSSLDDWFLSLEREFRSFVTHQRIFFEITYPSMRRITSLLRRRSHNVAWVLRNLTRISNYRSGLIRTTVTNISYYLDNLYRALRDLFK